MDTNIILHPLIIRLHLAMASVRLFLCSIFCVARNVCESDCTKSGAIAAYPIFIDGVKNFVATSDPISVDSIKGVLPEIKYTMTNAKLTGFKKCEITMLDVFEEKSTFEFHLHCPQFELNTDYSLLGYVGEMFIEGEGKLKVICYDYLFIFTGYYEKNIGKDNKEHVHIKKYFLQNEAKGKVVIDFQNLYGGDKEKSDAANKYLNDNWKDIDKTFRSPVLNAFTDVFISNLDKFLGIFPIEEVFPKKA